MNQELNEKKEDEHDEEVNKKKEEEEEEEEGRAVGSRRNLIKLSCGSPLGGRAVFHFRKCFKFCASAQPIFNFYMSNIN